MAKHLDFKGNMPKFKFTFCETLSKLDAVVKMNTITTQISLSQSHKHNIEIKSKLQKNTHIMTALIQIEKQYSLLPKNTHIHNESAVLKCLDFISLHLEQQLLLHREPVCKRCDQEGLVKEPSFNCSNMNSVLFPYIREVGKWVFVIIVSITLNHIFQINFTEKI